MFSYFEAFHGNYSFSCSRWLKQLPGSQMHPSNASGLCKLDFSNNSRSSFFMHPNASLTQPSRLILKNGFQSPRHIQLLDILAFLFRWLYCRLLLIKIRKRKPWGSRCWAVNHQGFHLSWPPKLHPPLHQLPLDVLLYTLSPSWWWRYSETIVLTGSFLAQETVAPLISTLNFCFLLTLVCPCPFIFKLFFRAVLGSQEHQTKYRDFPCVPLLTQTAFLKIE